MDDTFARRQLLLGAVAGGYPVGDGARARAKGAAYFARATCGREAEVLVSHC